MKITVIGCGYVGLVTGACFAEMGTDVTCVDVDEEKIVGLNKGEVPIYESGLKELIDNNANKTLFFSSEIEKSVRNSEIIIIAVGTPMLKNGDADLGSVFNVANLIGKTISDYKIIVTKSTVPVGTTFKVRDIIKEELIKRNKEVSFDVASNPEFLKEGAAIDDFMKPDRIVIGAEKENVFLKMKELYNPFFRSHDRFITMDILSSEMTKYAANSLLATKISFINEIANICEKVGADVNKVRVGIGSDSRIGYDFIYPGVGYGGVCFPKDLSALVHLSNEIGYSPNLLSSVQKVNENQKKHFIERVFKRFDHKINDLTFAIWGLSFKPKTDDMREAPSIFIVNKILEKGGKVKVYDPKAMNVAKEKVFGEKDIYYGNDKYEVVEKADVLILLTEWKEFRFPDFDKLRNKMNSPIIFDGRNQYKSFDLDEKGFEYYQVGVK
ncbi:UDP-glucose dehydrogenase family protein [Tenacibaculum halocynthiae]|uniref:UDP-glucose dehydrogenase family protein n=1 Tax=Tenacibaculum halocynthiae TaxID=1254437 RepID=UPI003D64F199